MPCCVAFGCSNKSDKRPPGVTFHSFPSEPEIREKWIRSIRRENWAPTKHSKVCSKHFREADLDRTALACVRVRVGAVPSIFEGFSKYKQSKKRKHINRKILRIDDYDDEPCLSKKSRSEAETDAAEEISAVSDNSFGDDRIAKEPQGQIEEESKDINIEDVTRTAGDSSLLFVVNTPVENSGFDVSDTESVQENGAVNSTVFIDRDSGINVIKALKLCFVCCSKEMPLSYFDEDSCPEKFPEITVFDMLNMHLPIQIEVDPEFPLQICVCCLDILCKWHELYITCKAAHNALRNVLPREKEQGEDSTSLSPEKINETDEGEEEQTLNADDNVHCNSVPQVGTNFPDSNEHASDNEVSETSKFFSEEEKENDSDEGYRIYNAQGTRIGFLPAFIKSCRWCGESFSSRKLFYTHTAACAETSAICDTCGKVVPTRRRLQKHNEVCHGLKIVCDICGETMRRNKLKRHKEYVHFPEELICFICCRIYRTKTIYNSHMKKHAQDKIQDKLKIFEDGKSDFLCPVCSKSFNEKLSLVKHLVEPKGMRCPTCRAKLISERSLLVHKCKKLPCPYCSKTYYSKVVLNDHIRHHTGEKPYICKICDYSFRTYSSLATHYKSHKPPTYECKYCSKKLKSTISLKAHLNSHEGVFKYPCTVCSKQYTSAAGLAKHSRHHMPSEDIPTYECEYCSKKLKSTISLKRHLDIHAGIYRYPCSKCSKKYSSAAALAMHSRVHDTNQIPFECKHCFKKLKNVITFKRHMNLHAGIYKYPCSMCSKKYTNSAALAKHARLHQLNENLHGMSESLPLYECKYCSKKLKSKISLKRHIDLHEGIFRYPCSNCSKKYTSAAALAKHARVHTTSAAIPKHIVVLQL